MFLAPYVENALAGPFKNPRRLAEETSWRSRVRAQIREIETPPWPRSFEVATVMFLALAKKVRDALTFGGPYGHSALNRSPFAAWR